MSMMGEGLTVNGERLTVKGNADAFWIDITYFVGRGLHESPAPTKERSEDPCTPAANAKCKR